MVLCVTTALAHSPRFLLCISIGRYEQLDNRKCFRNVLGYLKGNAFLSTVYSSIAHSCTRVSRRIWTAKHLLFQASGTRLWFGKGRPLICGLCGRGRWYCGLQATDGSHFSSKDKNSVDQDITWMVQSKHVVCSASCNLLVSRYMLKQSDSVRCVFKQQACFRGSRKCSKTSNKTPGAEHFLLHSSRACSSCSLQAKVLLLLISTCLQRECGSEVNEPKMGSVALPV